MSNENNNQLVYKDRNAMRILSPLFILVSPVFFLFDKRLPMFMFAGWAFVIFGVFATFFSSNLIVTADRSTRTLQLQYRFLLFHRSRNIPFADIADIQAQQTMGETSRGYSATMYRLVAVLTDGTVIPFRNHFTQNAEQKKWASRFRLFITGKRHSNTEQVEPPSTILSIS